MRPQMRRKIFTKIAPLVALAFLFTIIIPIYYLYSEKKFSETVHSLVQENPANDVNYETLVSQVSDSEHCDLFSGEWVPNPEGPYYTNMSCSNAIDLQFQNCMKFGRPDTDFFKWKWKPDACELPIFEPRQFLEIVKGKSLAFVGDSVARNHMLSLICLLSKVANPITTEEMKHCEYREYNFNMSLFWSTNLVRVENVAYLYLDELDESWATKIQSFDYVIISADRWFFHPAMFYLNHHLVGCQDCLDSNVSQLTSYFGYQRAFRTSFRAINNLKNYKGVTILRTFSPSHFENGTWDQGGDCTRTMPFRRKEKVLEDYNLEFYKIQLEELRIAQKEGRKRGLKFRLLDVTRPMLLRPDGHPSKYGHYLTKSKVAMPNDCVHWCLPGPIDVWNDFLLELLKKGG
ncbi:hypothetical protein RND71_019648 [Anisodus tanguticus]|uniref:Trichome birefringence-like N-terminal domain-containing protein n=1 Tax=Anisodus tanguticus TaxID=243964 RepID=A0AAE1S178_9SOLA|nr:hypothetical protein RND71_019648 [Anisodus tanguticus]